MSAARNDRLRQKAQGQTADDISVKELKKQKMLENYFFCPPAESLTEVEAFQMVVAGDVEPEPGRSVAARIAVKLRDSAACMMLCNDDVAPVVFIDSHVMCARQ